MIELEAWQVIVFGIVSVAGMISHYVSGRQQGLGEGIVATLKLMEAKGYLTFDEENDEIIFKDCVQKDENVL